MPKRKEKNSDEYYRGIIRELQKEVRQLKKQIRELEKYQFPKDYAEEFEEVQLDTQKNCPDCGKGRLENIDVVGRVFEQCNICNYRKKIK